MPARRELVTGTDPFGGTTEGAGGTLIIAFHTRGGPHPAGMIDVTGTIWPGPSARQMKRATAAQHCCLSCGLRL